jgi:flagella basal body P-ring formation protein FlgA
MTKILSLLLLTLNSPAADNVAVETSPAPVALAPVVRILEGAQIPSDSAVYFKNIAVFENLPEDYKTEVENIKLADNENEYAKMTSQDVLTQVRPVIKRIERECQCKINLSMPRSLQNHSMQGDFSLDKVTAKVKTILQNQCALCEYQIEPLQISQGEVPAEFKTWELDGAVKNLRGAGIISVYFDNKVLDPVLLKTQVVIKKPALKIFKSHSQGSQLDESHFEQTMVDATYENKKLAALADLESKELQRSMHAGQVLYVDDLTEQHLVRIGQPLSVEIAHGAFHIKLSGVAQRSGRKGEKIPVRINTTRKDIVAEVTGEGRVRMKR